MVYVKDELFHLLKLSFLRMLLLCYSILSLKMCPNFAFLQHLKSSLVFFSSPDWAMGNQATKVHSVNKAKFDEPEKKSRTNWTAGKTLFNLT